MTIDIAHIVLMACAGFLSLVMGLLSWSMKGLIDNAKDTIGVHDKKLDIQADRLNEHGRKIAVLEVRADSIENMTIEHQRAIRGGH